MPRNKHRPIPKLTPTDIYRFWGNVNICGPDECWPWKKSRRKGGYGKVKVQGGTFVTNRVAFCMTTGIDPGESLILHSCDNPPCCNPSHLEMGTPLRNSQEMVERGRACGGDRHWAKLQPARSVQSVILWRKNNPHLVKRGDEHPARKDPHFLKRGSEHWTNQHPEWIRGERNPAAKITADDVREIRRLHASGEFQYIIGAQYGLSQTTVGRIVNGKSWAHVD